MRKALTFSGGLGLESFCSCSFPFPTLGISLCFSSIQTSKNFLSSLASLFSGVLCTVSSLSTLADRFKLDLDMSSLSNDKDLEIEAGK